jgi:uncharacterized protein YndB with AHSA1/START domain
VADRGPDRAIREEVIVEASVDAVWDAWTTEAGVRSFFAPACAVELRVNGPYEIVFNPEAKPGQRGAEGMRDEAIHDLSSCRPLRYPGQRSFRS